MSSTLSLSSRVSCRRTSISGLISLMESRALSAFDRPTSDCPWMIWRCRLDSSTVSNSTMPSVPTPAAARYISVGEPSPPAPTASTLAFLSRFCPSIATSGMIRCREYRRTSSTVSDSAGSTRGGSATGCSSRFSGAITTRTIAIPPLFPAGPDGGNAEQYLGSVGARPADELPVDERPAVGDATVQPVRLLHHDRRDPALAGTELVAVAEPVADLVVHHVAPVE